MNNNNEVATDLVLMFEAVYNLGGVVIAAGTLDEMLEAAQMQNADDKAFEDFHGFTSDDFVIVRGLTAAGLDLMFPTRDEATVDALLHSSAFDEADEWELTRAALAEMEAEGHEFGHEFDETDLALGTE